MTLLNNFPCDQCGLCCRNISKITDLKEFDLGNGVCKFLDTQNNTCTIYNHGPEICRIDVMYEKVYKQHFDVLEFYTLNIEACNLLKHK